MNPCRHGDATRRGRCGGEADVMTNVATFERARIAERIAETKAYQKARGTYLGGIVPFGFVVAEGNLVTDVDLQSYVVEKSKAGPQGPSSTSCDWIGELIRPRRPCVSSFVGT